MIDYAPLTHATQRHRCNFRQEIDALVVKKYPLLDHKPGLIRAFEHATIVRAHDQEGREGFFVPKENFPALLRDILYFTMALQHYEDVPIGEEREIALSDFAEFCNSMGLYLKEHEQEEFFREIYVAGQASGGMFLIEARRREGGGREVDCLSNTLCPQTPNSRKPNR